MTHKDLEALRAEAERIAELADEVRAAREAFDAAAKPMQTHGGWPSIEACEKFAAASKEFWGTGYKNTDLIRDMASLIKRQQAATQALAVGHARYEEVRRWTPAMFKDAWKLNIETGKPFDESVDNIMPFRAAAIASQEQTK